MENQDEKVVLEIEETPETNNESVEVSTEGLSEKEIEIGTKSGAIPEKKVEVKDEHKEQSSAEAKNDAGKEEKPSFEDVEKDEKLLDRYSKPERGLYMKWKVDKHKRQEAQREKEELQAKLELDQVKVTAANNKLIKVKEMLKKGEELTADQLLTIIDEGKDPEPLPEKNQVDVLKQKISTKAQFAEQIGESKYDNFKEIANLAKEVIASDTTGTYQELIDKSFTDDKVDENMLVERVVNIARLSPKFSELTKEVEPKKKEEAARVITNAQKKISSAAISNAGGKRVVSEDELTVADAARLKTEQWRKLSEKTRKRILMGIDP